VERISEYGWEWGRLGWLAAFFYTVAAALRLARFNTRAPSAGSRYFEGLPSPSAAAVVAGLVWLGTELDLSGIVALALGFFLTAAAGALMVSRFPYYSFKEVNLGGRVPFGYVLLIPLIFVLIGLSPPGVLFFLFLSYAISGPVHWLWQRRHGQGEQETLDPAND
jgi:CDP-diacylglycerol--serine O-phosphatidyltransferase